MSPTAWNRLADATGATPLELAIVTFGDVHGEALEALTAHFEKVEQLPLDVAPRDAVAKHRDEFNRAVDAAECDWILVVRERETIREALAKEIADGVRGNKARGFRIRAVPTYCGAPLRIGKDEGEVRLFHRRYYLRYANKGEWQELQVQGTVMRLGESFASITFPTEEEHRAWLSANRSRRPAVGRLLTFVATALATRAHDGTTLRYLWNEAAWRGAGR